MLASCGFDRFGDPGFGFDDDAAFNSRISTLSELYAAGTFTVEHDIVVEGRVTANDLSGNFFQAFMIEDVTGAMEINAGFYDLHNFYREGQRVIVKTKGLALGSYNGVLQLGRAVNPYSSYRVESFGNFSVIDRYVSRTGSIEPLVPETRDIASLAAGDCGRLVRIAGLAAASGEPGQTWAYSGDGSSTPAEGVRVFTDGSDNEICVVTSGYADFAGIEILAGKISVTGILLYGKIGGSQERFAIKMRNISDVVKE